MRNSPKRQGSALVLTLLMLALMLTLILYYVTLIRLETQVSGFDAFQQQSRNALDQAVAEALMEIEEQHRLRADAGHAYLAATSYSELVSTGNAGALTGGVTLAEMEAMAWPNPASIAALSENASWVYMGDTNERHSVYAWVVVPLSGLLDPEAVEGWDLSDQRIIGSVPPDTVYFSPAEFSEAYPDAKAVFMPGAYSRDRGWFDFTTSTWQTNVTVGSEVLSMNPLRWTPAEVDEFFKTTYPDRDFVALAEAFLDYRDGKTVPTNPDGITAVPVPLFNEVTASMTVENLGGDIIEISHTLRIEIWNLYSGNPNSQEYEVPLTPALVARSVSSSDLERPSEDSDEDWTFSAPGGEVENAFAELIMIVPPVRMTKATGEMLEVDWNFEGLVLEELAGEVVDRLPLGLRLEIPAVEVPLPGQAVTEEATLEVRDPGLNHLLEMWVPASAPSIASVNQAAIEARGSELKPDGWVRWTPADRPDEWQESWAGFFPLDTPWRSIDLFSEEGQWWLLHTRPPEWEPGKWTRGKVNPNANQAEAFSAIFMGYHPSPWPGVMASDPVLPEIAIVLGQDLAADFLLDTSADQRGEWSDSLEVSLIDDNGIDRHEGESLLQKSLERMDTGYQLYGVIAWSETRLPDGTARSRQRKALLLWMDPYPNTDGRHAVKILLRHKLP